MSDRSRIGNAGWILLSTAIAGGVAYVVQLFAPALLKNDATYVAFSILWSAVYLGVSALSGVQQEFSRASHATATPSGSSRRSSPRTVLYVFGVLCVASLIAAGVITAFVASRSVPYTLDEVFSPVALALVGYLVLAIFTGVLAGMHQWRAVALVLITDAVLRAAVLLLGFRAQWDALALSYAVALPFGITAILGIVVFQRTWRESVEFDESARGLIRNSFTTVLGAVAMGSVISGLPLLIGVTMPGADVEWVAGALFAILITRAPIVTPAIAMQSFIVSNFRVDADRPKKVRSSSLAPKITVGLLLMVFVTAIATWVGPSLVGWLSAGQLTVSTWLMFAIVTSAFLTACLSSTAAILIARNQHALSAAGWAATAILTVVFLCLPLSQDLRLGAALIIPPLAGIAVHASGLRSRSHSGE